MRQYYKHIQDFRVLGIMGKSISHRLFQCGPLNHNRPTLARSQPSPVGVSG